MTGRSRRRSDPRRARLIVALVAVAAIVISCYAAFGPGLPFQDRFELRAVVKSTNQLDEGSDVRIAGISVGRVAGIEPGPGDTAVLTLQIEDESVPVRADARLKIEPRLALEGNYFVNVIPGSADAPELRSGATIPVERTSGPVQLDQVINTFSRPTRDAFAGAVGELADGLGAPAGSTASGHAGLRRAFRELDRSLGSVTAVARAAQGRRPGDLGRAVGSTGAVTEQLAADRRALADGVANFDATFAALAADERALAASVRGIDGVLRVAPPRLRAIDAALPSLTALARTLRPALHELPPTARDVNPLLDQISGIARRAELPTLLRRLAPVTGRLPELQARLGDLFPSLTRAMRCVDRTVVPALSQTIKDGPNTTGQPVWLEFMHMGANLASTASTADANGTSIRVGVTESEFALRSTVPDLGKVFTNGDIQGVAPVWLGSEKLPPYRPDQWCDQQRLPNLNTRYGARPTGAEPAPRAFDRTETRLLGDLRGSLATGRRSDVLRALVPLLERLGMSTERIQRQIGPLLRGGRR